MASYIHRKISLPTAFALALAAGSAVSAQTADDVTVDLTPDRQELTVGDRARLTLRVSHPTGYQVIPPRLPRDWGDFEVSSQGSSQTSANEEGGVTTVQVIEVALFAPGTFETPELAVTVRGPDGEAFERAAPPVSFTVRSVLDENDVELRDIRSQAELDVPPLWPWMAGPGLAVALGALAAYVLWRRRSSPALGPAPVLDTRSPYQVAMEDLDTIEQMDLPGNGDFKEHYTLVAECVRRYLEDGFQVPALDHTTDEIRVELRRSSVASDHSARATVLLRDADMVKFAKLRPEVDEAHRMTTDARAFVEVVRPVPIPEAIGTAEVGAS